MMQRILFLLTVVLLLSISSTDIVYGDVGYAYCQSSYSNGYAYCNGLAWISLPGSGRWCQAGLSIWAGDGIVWDYDADYDYAYFDETQVATTDGMGWMEAEAWATGGGYDFYYRDYGYY